MLLKQGANLMYQNNAFQQTFEATEFLSNSHINKFDTVPAL